MNSFKSFTILNLTKTLAKHFSEFDNAQRIGKALNIISKYVSERPDILYGTENIEEICRNFGLKRLLKAPEALKTSLFASMEKFLLCEFFRIHSINFSEGAEFDTLKLEFENSRSFLTSVGDSKGMGVAMMGNVNCSNEETRTINHHIQPSLTKLVISGEKQVDEFILQSFILNKHYTNFEKLSKFQKFQLFFLTQHLTKRSHQINKLITERKNTRFYKAGQNILSDYIANLCLNNQNILNNIGDQKFVPYLLELNGCAGVGKSTFVDLLADIMTIVFPFISRESMIYNRVNDKFWNGYRQQPIVLYDDSNQNEKLLFNLDNEIISIGGGQFTYPPMAFEKETPFSSFFIVFTTNKKLIETTKADKGAISRRIQTVEVTPKEELGKYIEDVQGKKWRYTRGLKPNVYNIFFNKQSPNYILNSFLDKMLTQIFVKQEENPCDEFFVQEIAQEQLIDIPSFSESFNFRLVNPTDKWANEQVAEFAEIVIEAKEQEDSPISFTNVKLEADSYNIHKPKHLIKKPTESGYSRLFTNFRLLNVEYKDKYIPQQLVTLKQKVMKYNAKLTTYQTNSNVLGQNLIQLTISSETGIENKYLFSRHLGTDMLYVDDPSGIPSAYAFGILCKLNKQLLELTSLYNPNIQ